MHLLVPAAGRGPAPADTQLLLHSPCGRFLSQKQSPYTQVPTHRSLPHPVTEWCTCLVNSLAMQVVESIVGLSTEGQKAYVGHDGGGGAFPEMPCLWLAALSPALRSAPSPAKVGSGSPVLRPTAQAFSVQSKCTLLRGRPGLGWPRPRAPVWTRNGPAPSSASPQTSGNSVCADAVRTRHCCWTTGTALPQITSQSALKGM